jgi:hypothetical protein
MKYIITESQYLELRKSTIKRFLRRVSHRLDEIVDESIQHILQFFPNKDLKEMGENGIVNRVIFDVFEYTYESYIEEDVVFSDEEQDIIKYYLYDRYFNHIRDEYLIQLDRSSINESEEIKKLPRPLLRRMKEIDDALKSVIKLYDIDEYNRPDFIDEVLHSIYDEIDYNDINEFFEYIRPMYEEKIGKIYDRKSKIRNSRRGY